MAAINHDLTEQDLHDINDTLKEIELKMYPDNPKYAIEGSRLITIGIFRNLFTPDVDKWIANRIREVFIVPVEKGHGNIN